MGKSKLSADKQAAAIAEGHLPLIQRGVDFKPPKTVFEAITLLDRFLIEEDRWTKHQIAESYTVEKLGESNFEVDNLPVDTDDLRDRKPPPVEKICMAGGIYLVDGPNDGDLAAAIAIAAAQLFPRRVQYDDDPREMLNFWMQLKGDSMDPDNQGRYEYGDDNSPNDPTTWEDTIASFNDASKTTKDDVRAVINRARDVLMAREQILAARQAYLDQVEDLLKFKPKSKDRPRKKPRKK